MNTKDYQNPVANDNETLIQNHTLDKLSDGQRPLDNSSSYDEGTYQYIRLYKRMVELKAIIFFVVTLLLFAYLYTKIYTRTRLSDLTRWTDPNFWTFNQTFYVASSICCLVSIVFCLIVMVPNLKSLMSGGALFNKTTHYKSQQNYVSDLLNITLNKLNQEKLISDLANVTSRKINAFRLSVWSGIICIFLIIFMVLIK